MLDILVHRHNIPQLMVHLHSFEFVCNPVAFEVWRREDAEFKTGSNMAGNAPERQKEKGQSQSLVMRASAFLLESKVQHS